MKIVRRQDVLDEYPDHIKRVHPWADDLIAQLERLPKPIDEEAVIAILGSRRSFLRCEECDQQVDVVAQFECGSTDVRICKACLVAALEKM